MSKPTVDSVLQGGDQAGLVRAEQMLTQAQKAVAARQGDLDAVNKQLDVCQKRLNEAKAQHKSTNKSSPAKQTAAGMQDSGVSAVHACW